MVYTRRSLRSLLFSACMLLVTCRLQLCFRLLFVHERDSPVQICWQCVLLAFQSLFCAISSNTRLTNTLASLCLAPPPFTRFGGASACISSYFRSSSTVPKSPEMSSGILRRKIRKEALERKASIFSNTKGKRPSIKRFEFLHQNLSSHRLSVWQRSALEESCAHAYIVVRSMRRFPSHSV